MSNSCLCNCYWWVYVAMAWTHDIKFKFLLEAVTYRFDVVLGYFI